MDKLKIKIVSLGQLPFKFDKKKIEKWKSDVFEIVGEIETLKLPSKTGTDYHNYSDKNLAESLPEKFNADILIAMTNVPLEYNWYSRRLSSNRVCFTFFQMADILRPNNIPLENFALRLIYSMTLMYRRHGNTLPDSATSTNFRHANTEGCLFDFNGIKSDIIYSTVKPTLCDDCVSRLQKEKVTKEMVDKVKKELKTIDKDFYFKVTDFMKEKPFLSLAISILTAILLGVLGSIIYDKWIKLLIH